MKKFQKKDIKKFAFNSRSKNGIHAFSGLELHTMVLVYGYKGCTIIMALGESMGKHYQKSHDLEGKQLPS